MGRKVIVITAPAGCDTGKLEKQLGNLRSHMKEDDELILFDNQDMDDFENSVKQLESLYEDKYQDTIYRLESNIDDSTGEALGFVMEELLRNGARDVNYMPVHMKKNRPGWQLNVICKEEDIPKMEELIFFHTTTIGIRRIEMERTILKREICTVNTPYGAVRVKMCENDRITRYYPEYEDVARLCRENGESYPMMYQMVVEMCKNVKK